MEGELRYKVRFGGPSAAAAAAGTRRGLGFGRGFIAVCGVCFGVSGVFEGWLGHDGKAALAGGFAGDGVDFVVDDGGR